MRRMDLDPIQPEPGRPRRRRGERRRGCAPSRRRPAPAAAPRLPSAAPRTARGPPATIVHRHELAALPWHGRSTPCARHARSASSPRSSSACRIAASTGTSAASVASSQSPRSPAVMRPAGSTAVASMHSMPAPDSARLPRWIMCQAVAAPSSAEYWHIGETTMRLGSVRPRSANGLNRVLMVSSGRW